MFKTPASTVASTADADYAKRVVDEVTKEDWTSFKKLQQAATNIGTGMQNAASRIVDNLADITEQRIYNTLQYGGAYHGPRPWGPWNALPYDQPLQIEGPPDYDANQNVYYQEVD